MAESTPRRMGEDAMVGPLPLGSGVRQGLPMLLFGGVSIGVSSWMMLSHVATMLGRLPLWPWLLTIGFVAILGGLGCSFLEWDAPPEDGLALDEGEIVVPRAEWERWLRVKVTLAESDGDGSFSEGPPAAPTPPAPVEEEPVSASPPSPPAPLPPTPVPAPVPVVAPSAARAPVVVPPVAPRVAVPAPVPVHASPTPPPAEKKLTESDVNETIRRLQSIIAAEKLLRGMGEADAYLHEVEGEIVEVERLTGVRRDPGEAPIAYCARLVQKLRVAPKVGGVTPPTTAPRPASPPNRGDAEDEFRPPEDPA